MRQVLDFPSRLDPPLRLDFVDFHQVGRGMHGLSVRVNETTMANDGAGAERVHSITAGTFSILKENCGKMLDLSVRVWVVRSA